jgi:nucleoside-diphosphate-sugar epimerase
MNRWPAIHRRDAARDFRMALESGVARPTYHAIAEEGITFKEIADAIAMVWGYLWKQEKLNIFGLQRLREWIFRLQALNRELVGWKPTYPGLRMIWKTRATFNLINIRNEDLQINSFFRGYKTTCY